jgi:hypothetical protein
MIRLVFTVALIIALAIAVVRVAKAYHKEYPSNPTPTATASK